MESSCRKRKRGGAEQHQQSNVVGFQEVPAPAWVDLSTPHDSPLPPGWEQCLDLQSGEVYFVNSATQTRVLGDPRSGSFKELAAGQSLVGKEQLAVTPTLELEMKFPSFAGAPGLSNQEIFFKEAHNHRNGICFNSNLNSNTVATNPVLLAATPNTDLNMTATVCLQCHTFVMVSRQSPHCPNCMNLCNVDPSVALGKHRT